MSVDSKPANLRERLHEIIFEAETPGGKFFDEVLMVFIFISVLVVMLDSVKAIHVDYGTYLYYAEWFFTVAFTVEYFLRLISVRRPARYARSFFGVIDFLAIIPTYLSLVLPASKYLLIIRILRLLRVFRVLKMLKFIGEASMLMEAMRTSRRKITIFLFVVLMLAVIMGSMMYVVEGEANGFTSIPRSIYWAIVTLTTVGYGDISPKTPLGMGLASIIMILGYSIIAVPTGIVTAEMGHALRGKASTFCCMECGSEGHERSAKFCKDCGKEF